MDGTASGAYLTRACADGLGQEYAIPTLGPSALARSCRKRLPRRHLSLLRRMQAREDTAHIVSSGIVSGIKGSIPLDRSPTTPSDPHEPTNPAHRETVYKTKTEKHQAR